jgi:lambda repressor-like predicted transcriptional regulator
VWRRSGSHNASGSKLSAGDLSALRIDDLRDLANKTGTQLPREPTKDGVISALTSKGVSLNDLTRGMLVDLSSKLGVTLGRDVDTMRKNLAAAVGKSGGYSPAPAAAASSWRTSDSGSSSSSSSGGDRWASYSRSSGGSSGSSSAGGSAGGLVSERELSGLKIDSLSELARKKGISMRNATKQDLVSQLSRVLKHSDLSKGQAAEIAAGSTASAGGRRW